MDDWRKLAAEAKSRKEVAPAPTAPIVSPSLEWGLPPDVASGLDRLSRMTSPRRLRNFDTWRTVVSDALRLAIDGWAGRALSLGWTPHDLFGVGTLDSHDFAGLAVWLEGRKLLMVDTDLAVVSTENGRAYFNRGGFGHGQDAPSPPIFLWEFGR